jgi:hypothetical protein
MTKNYFVGLMVAVAFLVAANVQAAGLIYYNSPNNPTLPESGLYNAFSLHLDHDGTNGVVVATVTVNGQTAGIAKVENKKTVVLEGGQLRQSFYFSDVILWEEFQSALAFPWGNEGLGFTTTWDSANSPSVGISNFDWDYDARSFSFDLTTVGYIGVPYLVTLDFYAPTPEPATLAMLGMGLAGLGAVAARRKMKK